MGEDLKTRGLAPLGELSDYRVVEGNPDIRGWEVYGADSVRIGEVKELLVDTAAKKARYMVVTLDRTVPKGLRERDVVVAVGHARLDDALERVYADDATLATAHSLPHYTRAFLDQAGEMVSADHGQSPLDVDRAHGAREAPPKKPPA